MSIKEILYKWKLAKEFMYTHQVKRLLFRHIRSLNYNDYFFGKYLETLNAEQLGSN